MIGVWFNMAATNANGAQQYWYNGVPIEGLKTANDTGVQKFWYNGVPATDIYPPSTTIKKFMSVDYASIKKISGVAIASVKKLEGIT